MAKEQSQNDTTPSVFGDGYNWETPLLTGRVISALASDSNLIKHTGKIAIVAEVAKQYKLVDENGKLPASLRSLRFILPMVFPVFKQYSWLIPDFKIPWFILLLTMLSSPKI